MNIFKLFTKMFVELFFYYICWILFTNMIENIEIKKQERGVVHLVLKATGENFFYGNLKALFDNHELNENDGSLGVAYNYMKNYNFSNGRKYENNICIIRKGIINTSTKKEWVRNNKKSLK